MLKSFQLNKLKLRILKNEKFKIKILKYEVNDISLKNLIELYKII